jgi:hypothetical protein
VTGVRYEVRHTLLCGSACDYLVRPTARAGTLNEQSSIPNAAKTGARREHNQRLKKNTILVEQIDGFQERRSP